VGINTPARPILILVLVLRGEGRLDIAKILEGKIERILRRHRRA